ncbi:LutC/YkgG family protein [Lignipirellula cremea]|uniref:Lactate utilization protein C n=1 Tax=Lignipirellula cremea TaxID=2528010 RepID=A0A518E2D5_9BACT|nr:LUD domain-containing protein [Lignipirellula cremea]QDU98255.1 Lactate utilization protein C [Lignipirellula cremea]
MNSRDKILQNVRRHLPEAAAAPSLDQAWVEYPDPLAHFSDVLASVGGRALVVEDGASLQADLDGNPFYADAKKIVSLIPGIRGNVDLQAVEDPHELGDVDFAVLPAQFAVAENGAVWVTDRGIRHRVVYFLPQHLALVIDGVQVVHQMHQAYARIEFSGPDFGVFISGPSKTADIEQSLVIGAHGPRSNTIYFRKS